MKKLLSLILSLAMVFTLAACGGDSANEPPASNPDPQPVEDNNEPAPAPETPPASDVTLTYWSMWNANEGQAKVIQEAVDAFTASTGIKVNIEWRGRDIVNQITAALESKTAIDIFDDDYQRIAQQYNAHLADLGTLVADRGYESKVQSLFLDIARDYGDGTLYTIPYQLYTSGIIYSKDAFDDAGVDASTINSWDGLIAACAALKDAGYTPIAMDGGGSPRYLYSYILARLIGQDACKDLAVNGGWSANEGAVKAAEYVIQLRDNGYVLDPIGTYPEGEYTIGFGESAMLVLPDYAISEIIAGTGCDIEWGFISFPDLGGVEDDGYANVGAQGFGIPAYSEHSEEAFQLIEWLTTGEWDQKLAEVSLHAPCDVNNKSSGLVADIQASMSALTGYYDYQCGTNENPDIRLNTEVQALFEGTYATAADFLAACDARYTAG